MKLLIKKGKILWSQNCISPLWAFIALNNKCCEVITQLLLIYLIIYTTPVCGAQYVLRPVKDWDQLNFTVFTMSYKHNYSKMKSNEVM